MYFWYISNAEFLPPTVASSQWTAAAPAVRVLRGLGAAVADDAKAGRASHTNNICGIYETISIQHNANQTNCA